MRPPSRAIAATAVLALAAGLAVTLPSQAALAAGPWPVRQPDPPHLVKGFPVPAKPRPSDAATAKSAPAPPRPSWPAAGTAIVTLPLVAAAPAATPEPATTKAVRAGTLPVFVGPPAAGAAAKSPTAPVAAAPASVRVQLLDRPSAVKRGVDGLLLRVRRADGVAAAGPVSLSVDYSAFRYAYGADWATRLRLVELPAAGPARVLPTHNDTKAGRVSAEVTAMAADTTVALTAAPNGQTGDYRATSLSPSGKWSVDAQSGDFTWSYPLKMPAVPGGLAPDLGLSYSSGEVDGHTAATNNQTSAIGEGWEMSPGYVERSYRSCYDDTTVEDLKTGDECWAGDNATLSLSGHGSQLVRVSDNLWRPKNDDGSRIEHLTGGGVDNGDNDNEYWKVTTTDGTQYFFGRSRESAWTVPVFGNDADEPCHDQSWCQQAYRWNLDQVVDTHGNVISYFWGPEYNNYSRNLESGSPTRYTRGGALVRAEYGSRAGQHPSAQVLFTTAERGGQDVPSDHACADGANCGSHYSPTFWSTKKLTTITTQVWDSAAWKDVDRWALDQTYPANQDGTTASLWLHGITHTGLAASRNVVGGPITLPAVTFGGVQLANRVNSDSDGLLPMDKWRMHQIDTETGGTVWVYYANPDCLPSAKPAPESNTLRCFPVTWVPDGGLETHDWMHKYVVSSVSQEDRVGGQQPQETDYDYVGGAGWHLDDSPLILDSKRTWSQYRGYEKVVVRKGDPTKGVQSASQFQYFRGLGKAPVTDSRGTALADDDQLAGFLREEVDYDGVGGPVLADTISDPWQHGPTATQGTLKSYLIRTAKTVTRTTLKPSGVRTTELDNEFTDQGLPKTVSDLGDVSTPADDRCVTTSYAQNTGAWLLEMLAEVKTDGVACGKPPSYPADAISDSRTYYDRSTTLGTAPTVGDITMTRELVRYASTPTFVTSTGTFDAYGRPLTSTDALNHTSTTSYSPATGLPTTITATDPLGNATTTTNDLVLGLPVDAVDVNGRHTSQTYDALARTVGVWRPGRSKDAGDGPTSRYAYGVPASGPSWVSTETLKANNNYVTSYQLYDGFLRARQTQAPGPNIPGKPPLRVLTDALYDTRGLTFQSNGPYTDSGTPGTALVGVNDNDLPSLTRVTFDGAGRPTQSQLRSMGDPVTTTTTAYFGDHTEVTPPSGATPTALYTDARGQATEQWQYHAATATGTHDVTQYRYDKAGNLARIVDAAGNTWQYTYDLLGRRTASVDPDKGGATTTYNDAGQVTSTKDARGITLAYSYDALGRKTEERDSLGNLLASWTYDTVRDGDTVLKALPASTTRYEGTDAYTTTINGYDAAYRPTGKTLTLPASQSPVAGGYSYTTNYTYKADGSPATVALPSLPGMSAETLTYTYDSLGFPITLTGGGTNYVHDAAYTAYGELSQLQSGDSPRQVLDTNYFDLATRRPTRMVTDSRRPEGTTTVADVNYGYDPAGNVTRIADTPAGVTSPDVQCFTYDAQRQLTDAWTIAAAATTPCGAPGANAGGPVPYWTTYGYDPVGNRLSETPHAVGGTAIAATATARTYTYPAPGSARPHAVTSVRSAAGAAPAATATTADYSYDAAGNTIARPGPTGQQALTWTLQGKLATVGTATGTPTSEHYDAETNLVATRDGGSVTAYLDGAELRLDTATKKATGTRYYTFGGGTVAVRTTSTGLSWMAHDAHGTDTVAVAAATSVAAVRRSDPFGNPRGTQPDWPTSRGFVGGTPQSTGTVHLGAREYDPGLGRFLSVDPVLDPTDPQQVNAYVYANNNPTTMTDPDGRFLSECDNCGYVDAGVYHGPGYTGGDAPHSSGGGSSGGGGGSHGSSPPRPVPTTDSCEKSLFPWCGPASVPPPKPKPSLGDLLNGLLSPNTPRIAPTWEEALLAPLIPPGPEGDAARSKLYAQSNAEAEANARAFAAEQKARDDRNRAAQECARSVLCTMGSGASSIGSDIGNFIKEHKEQIVHIAVSVGVSVAAGIIAAGACVGTVGIGCGILVGAAIGATAGVGANASAAYAMHEKITPGKLVDWALGSIPGNAIKGARGVTQTTLFGVFKNAGSREDLMNLGRAAFDKATDPRTFFWEQINSFLR